MSLHEPSLLEAIQEPAIAVRQPAPPGPTRAVLWYVPMLLLRLLKA